MKNFVGPGNTITVTAPAGGVTSGNVVIVGDIIGVANANAAAGADAELSVEGVFDLSKVTADALPVGSTAKVTPGTNLVGLAGTVAIGWITKAAASGSTTARVRLTPGIAAGTALFAGEQSHLQGAEESRHSAFRK
jgi:predicted RecA/RadA family phage recombinase